HQTISPTPGECISLPTINDNYVYIVVEEMSGPYLETEQTFREAYATLEDANRMVLIRQKQSDEEDWDNEYDKYGCCKSIAVDDEGDALKIEVERLLVRPPGSVPKPILSRKGSSESEKSHIDNIIRGKESSGYHEE
ncbi:MAG: hypothetical protein Q9167_007731, partial [Letrouitia subvulpina]